MMTALEQRERERVARVMAEPTGVFVFGSNRQGVHGKGAAKDAVRRYGAKRGIASGRMGSSYAIPTKQHWRDTTGLPLPEIQAAVDVFLAHARTHPFDVFAVTRIACGFAGYTDHEIAPLFRDAPINCDLPEGWR